MSESTTPSPTSEQSVPAAAVIVKPRWWEFDPRREWRLLRAPLLAVLICAVVFVPLWRWAATPPAGEPSQLCQEQRAAAATPTRDGEWSVLSVPACEDQP